MKRRDQFSAKSHVLEVALQPQLLTYDPERLDQWKAGRRETCSDPYCRKLPGTTGFGEFLAGQFFEEHGYRWIHHDFDIFGSNRPSKYPRSEAVLLEFFGSERLVGARSICKAFRPFRAAPEAPDLLVYRTGELRFAECKRTDTRDRLNQRQLLGLILISAVFGCPVDLFVVTPRDRVTIPDPIRMLLSKRRLTDQRTTR
ncbi:MAG TPA: hypothetical protein VGS57_11450 [Thermoanaerobaculia bacterium]|jgi:hypothetical protein|nr:hypothetical protein [Thermoanaerobaculia bacterium]